MSFEAVAYENDEKIAEALLSTLIESGLNDAYKEYDSIATCYNLYVASNDFPIAREIVHSFYENMQQSDDEEEAKTNIYENAEEKYKDNLSSAYTFLVCGAIGLILVILFDIGIIPVFTMTFPSKILFNFVSIGLFVIFIITGILSMHYSSKIKLDIDVNNSKIDEMLSYLRENLDLEDIESSYDKNNLPEEMYYFRRHEKISETIVKKFGEQPEDFLNMIVDTYLNEILENQ